MRPPRMTIRRWMIAVALVGCALGLVQFSPRARRLRARAEYHTRKQREALDALGVGDQVDEEGRVIPHAVRGRIPLMRTLERELYWEGIDALWKPRANYHGAMSIKYGRAARYPWLPVEPDPPEPQ